MSGAASGWPPALAGGQSCFVTCNGLFVALMLNTARAGAYSIPPALTDRVVSPPLMDGAGEGSYRCGEPLRSDIPSLLDRHSTTGFHDGRRLGRLFLTRFNWRVQNGRIRDLIRYRFRLSR